MREGGEGEGLTKRFDGTAVIEDTSFEVEQGRLVAIVGTSGSGKSTLIEAVAGRLSPDRGRIKIMGMEASERRMEINKLVGFVPQHPELNMNRKVWQNMMSSAVKYQVEDSKKRTEGLLKQLGIYGQRELQAGDLSGGQLKRLSLGMELLREPPILVLDEPTTGLDPSARDQIVTILSKMVFNQRKTCIFTTHFMDEAEHCDEVIIVGERGIIAKGPPSQLAKRMPGFGRVVEITLEEVREELVKKLKEERGIHTVIREGRVLKVVMDSPEAVEVSQKVKSLGGEVEGIRMAKAGMKEIFVHYTQDTARGSLMKGLAKAFRLEMEDIFNGKVKALSHFIIPIAIVLLLGKAGAQECGWCYYHGNIYSYFNFYSSLIFSTTMVFIGMQLTVLRIAGERAPYGTLDRDLLAISPTGMYLGKFLAALVVVGLQSLLVLVSGQIMGMAMEGSWFGFFIVLFLLSAVGLAFGLLFSVVSKSKEQAVQLVPLAVLIFLTLSGDLIPTGDMPVPIASFAGSFPVAMANSALRGIMLDGAGILESGIEISGLVLWVVGVLLAGMVKFSAEKR